MNLSQAFQISFLNPALLTGYPCRQVRNSFIFQDHIFCFSQLNYQLLIQTIYTRFFYYILFYYVSIRRIIQIPNSSKLHHNYSNCLKHSSRDQEHIYFPAQLRLESFVRGNLPHSHNPMLLIVALTKSQYHQVISKCYPLGNFLIRKIHNKYDRRYNQQEHHRQKDYHYFIYQFLFLAFPQESILFAQHLNFLANFFSLDFFIIQFKKTFFTKFNSLIQNFKRESIAMRVNLPTKRATSYKVNKHVIIHINYSFSARLAQEVMIFADDDWEVGRCEVV